MSHSATRHIISFSILLSSLLSGAQDLRATLALGDSMEALGQHGHAVELYSRALFFSPDSMLSEIFFRLGNSQERDGNYAQASLYYQRAAETGRSDSIRVLRAFDKMRCELGMGNWLEALGDLYSLPEELPEDLDRRRYFYEGVIYFGLDDFEAAAGYFKQSLPEHALADTVLIDSLLVGNPMLYKPIPRRAKILSIIVPGLGQLYAGDVQSALNSFLLNAVILGLAVYTGAQYGLINAFFTVMPWYQRYFTGGFTNAETIAVYHRDLNRADAYRQVLRIIAAEESSGSP